jgi:helicase
MTYRSVFIGINKHCDPKIRDLSGARRDAEALWSLFHDTLPNLKSHFLVDEQATKDAIEQALQDCLEQAQANDVVIVTFSGHGTMSHRLVAHDTSYDLQNDTMSPCQI